MPEASAGEVAAPVAEQPPSARASEGPGLCLDGLAMLPERTIVDETRLASLLGVSTRTVRRMVRRFQLPAPIRLGGRAAWFVGKVLDHFEAEAEREARKMEKLADRHRRFSS